MNTDVSCYSGSMYAEKPLAFLYESKNYRVAAVLDEKRSENGKSFLVRTEEDTLFCLFYDVTLDTWQITSL